MVRCWFMQSFSSDSSALEPIDLEDVMKSTGIIYYYVDPLNYRSEVDRISKQHSYKREDIADVRPGSLENYQEMIVKFRTEHQHPDEEVRFALKGKGYFDVRNRRDEWIRIEVTPGDFLILPSGIYHRFQFHEDEIGITFLRLFTDDAPYRIFFRNGLSSQAPVKQQGVESSPLSSSGTERQVQPQAVY